MKLFSIEKFCLAVFSAMSIAACSKEYVGNGGAGDKLPAPKVSVSDVTCASFKLSWTAVTDAGSYTYVFNGGDTLTTKNTSLSFDGLSPKSENTLSIRTDAGSNGNYRNSDFVNMRILTNDVTVLETPSPEVVAAYVSKTIISWNPVSEATAYEYSVGKYSGKVTKCSVELPGFEPSTDYVFSLKAVSDSEYVKESDVAELKFVTRPAEEDIPQIVFSHVETGADYTTFNVYALPDFHYLYFCWPETYLTGMTDTEIRDLYLNMWLQSLKNEGVDVPTGVSQYSCTGSSAYVGSELCSELTYRVGIFGVDMAGNAITPLYGYTTKTIAENTSPIPDFSGADWFMQSLMLPTGSGNLNATNCLGLFWIGKNVTKVVSLLTSTRSYKNYFNSSPDSFREYIEEYGTVTEDKLSLSGINSDKGFAVTYQGLSSATCYTAGAVVTNSDNETAFFLNSMPTRTSTKYTSWANVTLGRVAGHPAESSLGASFEFAFDPKSEPYNFHVAGVRYHFCKYTSDLEAGYDAEQIVERDGIDMPKSSIDLLNMSGSLSMVFGDGGAPLEPRTKYIILATFTERNGDKVTCAATATTAVPATNAAVKSSAGGRPSARILFNAPVIIDVYEPVEAEF